MLNRRNFLKQIAALPLIAGMPVALVKDAADHVPRIPVRYVFDIADEDLFWKLAGTYESDTLAIPSKLYLPQSFEHTEIKMSKTRPLIHYDSETKQAIFGCTTMQCTITGTVTNREEHTECVLSWLHTFYRGDCDGGIMMSDHKIG